jgi:hypothetical protein
MDGWRVRAAAELLPVPPRVQARVLDVLPQGRELEGNVHFPH